MILNLFVIYILSNGNVIKKGRKCCAIRKSRNISCYLRDIFFAQPLFFYLYATFNVLDFLWIFFQPGALKTTNTLECGINKRFGTNTEVTVNLFDVISIIFSFPFNLVLRAILKKSPFSYSD